MSAIPKDKFWKSNKPSLRKIQLLNDELTDQFGLCIFISPLRMACWNGKKWHDLDASKAEEEFVRLQYPVPFKKSKSKRIS